MKQCLTCLLKITVKIIGRAAECIKQNTNNGRLFSYSLRSNANCKLCDENKGMLESLFSTDTVYSEIEFPQRKLLKVLYIPLRLKKKKKEENN